MPLKPASLLSCLGLFLCTQVSYAFEPEMLVGKWINSDLDQVDIRVTGKQITLTRNLKWDGLRPSSQRVYDGKFKANFIPLWSRHETPGDYSEILPPEIRTQLVAQKPLDKLIVKMLNQDNLRIDYYPTLVTYQSHQPTQIGTVEASPDREIIRYKRWGRYTIDKFKVKTKNAAEIEKKSLKQRQHNESILQNQTDQLTRKKHTLRTQPKASFLHDEKRLIKNIQTHNAQLVAEKKKPLPKAQKQTTTETDVPKIDYAAIQQRTIEQLTKQRDQAIEAFANRIQNALDHSYLSLPNLLQIRDIDDTAFAVKLALHTLRQQPEHGFHQQPMLESVILMADKTPVYRAKQHSPHTVPQDVQRSTTLFESTKTLNQQRLSALWQLRQQAQQLLQSSRDHIRSIDATAAQQYIRHLKAHPDDTPTALSTPFKQRVATAYSLACFARTDQTKAPLEEYANSHNNQWLFALTAFNQSFSEHTEARHKRGTQDYLAALNGDIEHITAATRPRLKSIAQIGERQQQANKQRLTSSLAKQKKGRKARKIRQKAQNQYKKQTTLNQKALLKLQKSAPKTPLKHLKQRLAHRQTQYAQWDKLMQQPHTWADVLAQCRTKIPGPIPRILPSHFSGIHKDIQLSLLTATAALYWDIHQAWLSEKLEAATLAVQQQRLSKQMAEFQQEHPSQLKKIRNSPFQKPTTLSLILKVSHWKNVIPKVRIHTQYQNIPFSLKPKHQKIGTIPGTQKGQPWQEIHYFFESNAFKHADYRSKLVLQVDFSPAQ